jgi:hypothetical protein
MNDDTQLLDFLADPAQNIAQVLLPADIVERNVHSLRDAIREAMRLHSESIAKGDEREES